MKTLRKFNKTIATTLLIIFSSYFLTGCYTLESTTKISTERIPRTEKKTGVKKYTYKTTLNPLIDNPEVNLKINKGEQYKVKTKIIYEKKYHKSEFAKTWKWAGLPVGFLAGMGIGWLCADYDYYDSSYGYPSGYSYSFWGEASWITAISTWGIVLVTWIRAVSGKQKHKYYKPFDYEYFFKNLPLPNSDISITSSNLPVGRQGKSIMFKADNNALLRFNLVNDFNITNSTNNNPVIFNLKYNNKDFDKSLKLQPSLWMYKYAKINVPECDIKTKLSQSSKLWESLPTLAIARKGMEYKILIEKDNNYKIELPNKTGWLNALCADTYYSIPKKKDISIVIKNYVEEKMNLWQKQGEFETPKKYQKRMLTRGKKLKEITGQAMDMFQQDYANLIDWERATISRYYPNSETFKIDIPDLDTIIISVPNAQARSFKKNWGKVSFKNQKFVLVDGDWELSSLALENTAINYTAKYNSKISNNYDPTNQFAFNLEPINVVIPTQNKTETTNEIFDTYSINTNLPQTNMSNPDAIAVVIGNSNYLLTEPVNFAINDAQLMKAYLTNVLGFKPDNIMFKKNLTKGQLENIFGTKDNYKGKLYDWVKSDVADVFIFYSGHGAPGINDKEAYLVPVDCDPMRVEMSGYPLKQFYNNLSKIPAKSTTVILDACFSGAGVLKNISSIRIKPKENATQIKNSVIITSSSGDEVSSWYNAKQHGLFTYFFLKAIHAHTNSDKSKDKNLTFQEIFNYLSDKTEGVPYYARRLNNGIEQHPTIQGNAKDRVFVKY